MNKTDEHRSNWLDFLVLLVSFLGAIVSMGGAIYALSFAAQVDTTPVWPLPGYVLTDWAVFGLIGFLMAFLSSRLFSAKWLQAVWIITGTFIPLIILGAFSIGLLVLIAFLLFLIATIILSFRNRAKWLESFGLLMLGAICNAGILYLLITFGNRSY